MKKGYFLMFIVLLMVSMIGCGSEEAVPEPEFPEEMEMEETVEPEEEDAEKEVSDPAMAGETCWTDMELDDRIEVPFMIEGMEERIALSLYKSQQHPFGLYVDEERYEWKEEDGKDFLIPYHQPDDKDVWMVIWHEEKTVEEAVEEKRKKLEAEYAETIKEDIKHPLKAVGLKALQQRDGDDVIEDWYVVEAQDGGVFLIQQKLFTEALEGHGRRFDLFLEHFYGAKAPTIQLTLTEDARSHMEEELQLEQNEGKVYVLVRGSS